MVNQLSWYLKKGFRGVESAFQKRGLFFNISCIFLHHLSERVFS